MCTQAFLRGAKPELEQTVIAMESCFPLLPEALEIFPLSAQTGDTH